MISELKANVKLSANDRNQLLDGEETLQAPYSDRFSKIHCLSVTIIIIKIFGNNSSIDFWFIFARTIIMQVNEILDR